MKKIFFIAILISCVAIAATQDENRWYNVSIEGGQSFKIDVSATDKVTVEKTQIYAGKSELIIKKNDIEIGKYPAEMVTITPDSAVNEVEYVTISGPGDLAAKAAVIVQYANDSRVKTVNVTAQSDIPV